MISTIRKIFFFLGFKHVKNIPLILLTLNEYHMPSNVFHKNRICNYKKGSESKTKFNWIHNIFITFIRCLVKVPLKRRSSHLKELTSNRLFERFLGLNTFLKINILKIKISTSSKTLWRFTLGMLPRSHAQSSCMLRGRKG